MTPPASTTTSASSRTGRCCRGPCPRGPRPTPSDKRLAIRVEDHDVDYLDFEGTIPEGSYGAGTVEVWDIGTWANETTDDDGQPVEVAAAVDGGHLRFSLDGSRLDGGFVLQRFRPKQDQWLLIKIDDEG